jgi:hypothetical protein
MRIGRQDYRVDYGHLAFLTLIAAYISWFLYDTISVSRSVNNLLLVAPVGFFGLFMALLVIPQCLKRADAVAVEEKPQEYDPLAPKLPTERSQVIRMLLLGGAHGLFVLSLIYIGFDVAIFLFAAAAMAICGERRPLYLIAVPAAVAVVGIYGFRALMSFPMPTLLL